MGLGTNRPPLPASTDISSADDTTRGVIDEVATDISRVTDKTSYSIPEDGSPITIPTKKGRGSKSQSQTSLLIEVFEGGKAGDNNVTSRPSVRVRVTPSSSRKSKAGEDHVRISQTDKSRKPTYTRRISLPGRSGEPLEGTEVSHSSQSSGRAPIDVEVLQHSDLDDTRFVPTASDISSMPADSLVDGEPRFESPKKNDHRDLKNLAAGAVLGAAGAAAINHLTAPKRSRSRSLSRERITQKVMEKLKADPGFTKESSSKNRSSRSRSVSKEEIIENDKSSRNRSSKDRDYLTTEPNLNPSELSAVSGVSGRSGESMRSGISNNSINNPKLLHAVEDAIRRLILPELNALKEEQNLQKKRMKYEELSRDSRITAGSIESSRLSKTSSLPDVSRKPGIVTDDRGVILESSKHRKHRRTSRESDKSYDTTGYDESPRRRSSREKSHHKEATLAAGLAGAAVGVATGAGLTYANLKHHDSMSSMERERRKRRTKSRSRTTSLSESITESPRRKHERDRDAIPPLPMQSTMESDLTRDSILSAETERPEADEPRDVPTPTREYEVREVSRGSRQATSTSPRTPTRKRTPVKLRDGSGSRHDNVSPVDYHSASPQEKRTMSAKAEAALIAAGTIVGAAATKMVQNRNDVAFDNSKAMHVTPARHISPVKTDESHAGEYPDLPMHDRVRSIKSAESVSSSRKIRHRHSDQSAESVPASPSLLKAKNRPQGFSLEKPYEILPEEEYEAETPQQSDVDEWFERNHAQNEIYRSEIGSRHGHYDPSVESGDGYTVDSAGDQYKEFIRDNEQDIRYVGANPEYVHTPVAVESAVASLQGPSSISVHSSEGLSPTKEHHLSQADSLTLNRNLSYTSSGDPRLPTSKERWEAIRDQAIASTTRYQQGGVMEGSPRQSTPHSINQPPVMGASAVPVAGEEIPEIGMGLDDDESEVNTNPSLIQGPIGGLEHGDRSHWPYDPTPTLDNTRDLDVDHDHKRDGIVLGTAAAVAGAAIGLGLANARSKEEMPDVDNYAEGTRDFQPTVEDEDQALEREVPAMSTPYGNEKQPMYMSSPGLKDEGYVTGVTPEPYTPADDALNALGGKNLDRFVDEDPFTTTKHLKHESGLSHGMASPLYDAATGKGVDRIQSRDVVALMDHLTVRDAQRNARDTEILVTLVRSAAEMRNSFEEIKRFIAEQERIITNNMERGADMTAQKVLSAGHGGGPRPMPERSVRPSRSQTSEETDIQNKRQNIFRRALKGLTSRSSSDLKNIEEMLMQLLDEVEGLKSNQSLNQIPQAQNRSLDSYERLRLPTDPGYEPEGRAGTASTPNQSGYLSNHSSRRLNSTMHSGFDHDRRGSDGHRISTVLEGDEEVDNQNYQPQNTQQEVYDDPERMDTPTQEVRRAQTMPMETPPEQAAPFRGTQSTEDTPGTGKSRKHKSAASSLFGGFPKISRWSKTTASSEPEPDSAVPSIDRKDGRLFSEASRSGSQIDMANEYEDGYDLQEDDRIRSQSSLVGQQQAGAAVPRSPSPLIPEERRSMEHPKYHAHRNSLNLEHPQPRPGPTHRHQTYLESQAVNYENPPTPDQEDLWGSGATMALNRNRFSAGSTSIPPALSPVYSDHSASEQATTQAPARPPKLRDDGPLVPAKPAAAQPTSSSAAPAALETTRAYDRYAAQLAAGAMHVPSPLEPIAEVRYSLETDGVSVAAPDARDALTPSPHPVAAGPRAPRDPARRVTGPRDMPAASRRRPVPQREQLPLPLPDARALQRGGGPPAERAVSPASGRFVWME